MRGGKKKKKYKTVFNSNQFQIGFALNLRHFMKSTTVVCTYIYVTFHKEENKKRRHRCMQLSNANLCIHMR